MKKRTALLAALPVLVFALSMNLFSGLAQSPNGLPPLPQDLTIGQVIFPNAYHEGTLEADTSALFVFLAFGGEQVKIELERLEGDFVPYLEISSPDQVGPLAAENASDLAGKRARLTYTMPRDGWYYLRAAHDPASNRSGSGTYRLTLTGASADVYEILEYGPISRLEAEDRVLLHHRELLSDVTQYYLPVRANESIIVDLADSTGELYNAQNVLLTTASGSLTYTADTTGWLRLHITSDLENAAVALLFSETPVAPFSGVLDDLLTLTPTATATATPTATRTATATPTATSTPTLDPNICNGHPITYAIGQKVIVDFNGPNAMRLIVDLHASRHMTIAQAYDNQTLEIVDGPDCFDGRWFWQVFLASANAYGWVPEADDGGDYFLCPQNDPECRRYGGG